MSTFVSCFVKANRWLWHTRVHTRTSICSLFFLSETVSHMLESRIRDKSKEGLKNWIMDSIHMWGESPRGEWVVKFMDIVSILEILYFVI